MSQPPSAEDQLAFLFRVQRILTEGSFDATYKFALLLALADLAIERADDTTSALDLDTQDIAAQLNASIRSRVARPQSSVASREPTSRPADRCRA